MNKNEKNYNSDIWAGDNHNFQVTEENEPLISVLLPAYNVEKYIGRCIESILCQTYKNIEVIIVVDGSPDSSGEIAERYSRKDNRVKVFYHSKNMGFSETRNTGIKHASGEYITFVDSDDWVESDYIAYLFSVIKKTGADIAISRNFFTSRFQTQITKDKITVMTPEDMLCDIFYNRIHVGVWNRIYKSSLIKERRFRPESRTGEGMQFNTQVVPLANSIGVGLRRVYTYNVDNDSSATKMPSIVQSYSSVETMDYIKNNLIPRTKRLDDAVEYQYFTTSLYALNHLIRARGQKNNYDFYKRLIKYCRGNALKTLKVETSGKQKLKSLLVWVSPVLENHISIFWRYKLGIKQKV